MELTETLLSMSAATHKAWQRARTIAAELGDEAGPGRAGTAAGRMGGIMTIYTTDNWCMTSGRTDESAVGGRRPLAWPATGCLIVGARAGPGRDGAG